jgi:hypothetical protein
MAGGLTFVTCFPKGSTFTERNKMLVMLIAAEIVAGEKQLTEEQLSWDKPNVNLPSIRDREIGVEAVAIRARLARIFCFRNNPFGSNSPITTERFKNQG